MSLESIVVVTRKTALEELIARFNTQSQTQFYLEQTAKQNPGVSAPSYAEYQEAHEAYHRSLDILKADLPKGLKHQIIERSHLPNFQFSDRDLVITIGPDGLVINTAKYLSAQPILAFNPDPKRIDGVLIPYRIAAPGLVIAQALGGELPIKPVSMAKAQLNDGQTLYAVNDLFIGVRSHVSARYRIEYDNRSENQCSSGIIVSTGAGSTGWLSSIIGGAQRIASHAGTGTQAPAGFAFDATEEYLYFAVREPFISKTSNSEIVFGRIDPGKNLILTSQMPENGIIFSDGIEADFVQFNSGAVASITLAERKANLLVKRGTWPA